MRFEIVPGDKIVSYTNTFPARRYWYRHDTVLAHESEQYAVQLEGFIQVRYRAGRYDITTCYENSCVMGRQPEWLYRQNVLLHARTD